MSRTILSTGLGMALFALGAVVGCIVSDGTRPTPAFSPETFVTGIGGVFYKVDDPKASREWYRQHLGIEGAPGVNFFWRERDDPDQFGFTVWSVFPRASDYFGPTGQDFMINYRVRDLDSLLTRLQAQGVQRTGEIEAYPYGRFAWVVDGDGNRVELWEPANLSSPDISVGR